MGQTRTTTTFTLTAKHPVFVSFTCEHCGEANAFIQEVKGTRSKSYSGARSSIDPITQSQLTIRAQEDLAKKVKDIETKVEKGKFSWIDGKKCTKCKRYQSWQVGRIWKNFFSILFGAPIGVAIVGGILLWPISAIFFRGESNDLPDWIGWVFGVIILLIEVFAVADLVKSLKRVNRENPTRPTVIL